MPKSKKIHPTTQYATDVTDGKISANKWTRLACQRHLGDLDKGEKRGLYFDESAANHIIMFFEEFLVFYEGEFDGKPFLLTPWQKFLLGSIFGWKKKPKGYRRFKTVFCSTGKGNGKSPVAAGIGLYGLCFDDEPGSEVYAAATAREQAGILFRDARTFAEKSPSLKEFLRIDKHNIAYEAQNAFFRPVSSEHRGLDGKRPHICLIDEIHEHPNDLVVRKMSAGTKGRRQPLIFEITNAGTDRHSICYQHHEYTTKILEGIVNNDEWFGLISGIDICPKCESEGKTVPQHGCPDCDDWQDEKNFIKANPNLEYLGEPFKDYLRRQIEEARAMPSQENIVKRLNLGIWTESITKWISSDTWNACTFTVDPEKLKGRSCYAGLDLSSNTDLTAWVLIFPPIAEGGKYEVLCRFFLPDDNMRERVHHDKVPYDVWVRQGYIITTPGNIIDYAFILDQIEKDMADYEIKELAFDRWGSQKITTDLQDLGFEIEGKRSLIQFGQGFASMSAPTKELEKMVLAKEIAHGGNPVLSWMMSNISIREDPAGNKKPDKEKSTEHIDGVVALIMAIGRAMLNKGPEKSAYEDDCAMVLTF
jgi:phage terminase large subunit-like protein